MGYERNSGKLSPVAFRAPVQICSLFYCDYFLAIMQNKIGFNSVLTGQIDALVQGKVL